MAHLRREVRKRKLVGHRVHGYRAWEAGLGLGDMGDGPCMCWRGLPGGALPGDREGRSRVRAGSRRAAVRGRG